MTTHSPTRLVVVTSASETADETIAYALREARETTHELGSDVAVTVVSLRFETDEGSPAKRRRRFERQIQAEIDQFDDDRVTADVHVTEGIWTRDDEHVRHLLDEFDLGESARVVFDPAIPERVVEALRQHSTVGGHRTIERAPVTQSIDRRRLLHPRGIRRLLTVFGTTYLFYLAVGGTLDTFDLFTGAISAGVVAVALSRIALKDEPTVTRTLPRLLKSVLFLPYLLWEIAKANVAIAYVILHPSLPIDPAITTFEAGTESELETAMLANVITLTPGTVTLDVRGQELHVHSLTEAGREDLVGSRLSRAVGFVFGRERSSAPSDQRGDDDRATPVADTDAQREGDTR